MHKLPKKELNKKIIKQKWAQKNNVKFIDNKNSNNLCIVYGVTYLLNYIKNKHSNRGISITTDKLF